MTERVMRIACADDVLLGVLHPPAAPIKPHVVLMLVGGPQYRVGSHRQFVLAARQLARAGYGVLRFDFRGMGDSTGSPVGFESVGDETQVALEALLREIPSARSVCVFGLCDAASAALIHCTKHPRVGALILANPWVRTEQAQAVAMVRHYYGHRLFERSFWKNLVRGGFNPFAALRELLAAWRKSRIHPSDRASYIEQMRDGLGQFKGAVLLLMSGRDLTAREFDDRLQADESWHRAHSAANLHRIDLPTSDHTFSDPGGLVAANAAIIEFLQRLKPAE